LGFKSVLRVFSYKNCHFLVTTIDLGLEKNLTWFGIHDLIKWMKFIIFVLLVFSFSPVSVSHAAALFSDGGEGSGSVPGRRRPRSRPTTGETGECRIQNAECTTSGSHVQIDLAAQCMCVGSRCVEVGIGLYGPNQTRNGTGTLGPAPGGLYNGNRFPVPGTTSWAGLGNEDGLSTGIPQNDRGVSASGRNLPVTQGGKWIHKAANCNVPARNYTTAGCVAVACEDWPLVKSATGRSVTICGGARTDAEIISRNGCVNTRSCPPSQRRAPLSGCNRVYSRLLARGQRPAGTCVDHAGNRVAFPGLSNVRTTRSDGRGVE
jgi:hypothetical protein